MSLWQFQQLWENGGWPMWPLAVMGGGGVFVSIVVVVRVARRGLSDGIFRYVLLLGGVSGGCVLAGLGFWWLRLRQARAMIEEAGLSLIEQAQVLGLASHYLRVIWVLGVVVAVPPVLVMIYIVLRGRGLCLTGR